MDPLKYNQIVRYKTLREYPVGMKKRKKNTFRKQTHTYDIEGGELYYVQHKGTPKAIKTKVVNGPDKVKKIFADFHASTTGAHHGQKKTRDAISSRFYWPEMSKDINTWVSQCVACQASQTEIEEEVEYTPPVPPPVVTRPAAVVTPFAPAAEKSVQDAWKGKVPFMLLSKIGPYKIFSTDIKTTAPNNELGSEVIDAYLTVLVQDFNRYSKEMARVIDSSAMTDIWKGKSLEPKLNPKDYNLLLGVINENNYWLLMVIFPSQKRSLLFDPFGEFNLQMTKFQEVTRALLRDNGCNVSSVTVRTLPHPCQTDRSSSGVFTLKFAESILKGDKKIHFQTSDEELTRDRFAIAKTLLRRADDLSQHRHIHEEDDSDMLDLR